MLDDVSAYQEYKELLAELKQPETAERRMMRQRLLTDVDEAAFERILGVSSVFPVNYLERGARAARSVATIMLIGPGGGSMSSGSGFLVAPGLLLTTKHVLPDRDTALRSKAVFDFAEDHEYVPMRPKRFSITKDIFFTSTKMDMDFSFVSIAPVSDTNDDLAEFGQLVLIEESGKALKGEFVSIIQHPYGESKQIALRESKIVGVKGDFIYYTGGVDRDASGSPVLNDDWLPVALHQIALPDPENPGKRGVRISRIFGCLRDAQEASDPDATMVLSALEASEMAPKSDEKLDVFISYSHEDDSRWLNRVQVHLKPLARDGRLDLWDDTRIKGGDRWRQEIKEALARAKVAVLLISADFYASDFINKNELPPLLEAARKRGLRILGVHINYSGFDRYKKLSEYQTINPPGQPIEALSKAQQEKVFDDLARRIEELLEPTVHR